MKLLHLTAACALLAASSANVCAQNVTTNKDIILHAWSWDFNTIKDNLKDIKDAGYTIVQTSPANACVDYDHGKNHIFSEDGTGNWYYYYQPVDWKIGNYMLGSRDEFKALCDEAKKYGVRVIVDVLPNHTCIDKSKISAALDSAVCGRERLFHANGLTPIKDYNDRLECTTGEMGGLPDVNTENPDFQEYYMRYVNDLIQCGAGGFRYDTAKHIGLPSDPLDPRSAVNDFWDVATGRKSVHGVKLCVPFDSLFVYAEILQDKNVKEEEYGEYMGMCASNYGWSLCSCLDAQDSQKSDLTDWASPVDPYKLTTWVESHDTYCNSHPTAKYSDAQIRVGWALITARQNGNPLFFSRPNNSDGPKGNYWGDNLLGAKGNDNFKHPEVAAVNKFRAAMQGQPEKLVFSGALAVVERGTAGAAIVNFSKKAGKLNVATSLPDGKYKDKVYGKTFTVKGGVLTGSVKALTSYVIY